jgi:hypothetical protein
VLGRTPIVAKPSATAPLSSRWSSALEIE